MLQLGVEVVEALWGLNDRLEVVEWELAVTQEVAVEDLHLLSWVLVNNLCQIDLMLEGWRELRGQESKWRERSNWRRKM